MDTRKAGLTVGTGVVLLLTALYYGTSAEQAPPKAPPTGGKIDVANPPTPEQKPTQQGLGGVNLLTIAAQAGSLSGIKKYPTSLAELTLTPGMEEGFRNMGTGARAKFDYKLGFLSRLEVCLDGQVSGKGWFNPILVYEVDLETNRAVGVDLEWPESLPAYGFEEEATEKFTQCALNAHVGYEFDFKEHAESGRFFLGEKNELYLTTPVLFPLEENNVYKFIDQDGDVEWPPGSGKRTRGTN